MPRRRRLRKVVSPPGFKGYKPYGSQKSKSEKVQLYYEEYEAIKLADYDGLNHLEASEIMGISRATFARIYETARQKIAKALVETREIESVFGNAWLDESWYICNDCHARFTIPQTKKDHICPLCRSSKIESLNNTNNNE